MENVYLCCEFKNQVSMKDLFTLLIALPAMLLPFDISAQPKAESLRPQPRATMRGAVQQVPLKAPVFNAAVKAPAKAVPNDGREYVTVIEEDFSLFTAGTPDNPDKTYLEGTNEVIPSKYTHTPGWKGRGVMSAGGAVCLGFVTDAYTQATMTGQLELPALDLHKDAGRAYLSFKAKPLPPDVDVVTIRWVTEPDLEHPFGTTGDEQTVYIQPGNWQTVEVDLTECPENACVQIFSEYHELLIDDVKIMQHQPEVDAPKALKWTDYTGDSFTAHWTKVENADHYVLNAFYIRREATEEMPADYKYILKDASVADTCYHFTGLKEERVYYYYVRAASASGQLSEESQVVEVMALKVPSGIEIKNVEREGFDVSWEHVYNAESYEVSTMLAHHASEEEDFDLVNDDFSGIVSNGSVGDPYGNTYGYYDMNVYGMNRAGWVMYDGGIINGGLCFHNYISSYGEQYYGELVSPIYIISQSTGDIIIEADYATTDPGVKPYIQVAVVEKIDGKSTWVLGAGGEINVDLDKNWKHVKLQYKVKPGIIRFSLGCTDGGWLYMDNLRIAAHLPKDGIQIMPYNCREVYEEEGHSLHVATADRTQSDAYGVSITAIRRKPGSYFFPIYIYSDESPIYDVPDIDWTGVSGVSADANTVSALAVAGGIGINNPAGVLTTVSDLSGRTVARTRDLSATITLPTGIYIVSAKGYAAKVFVK